MKRKLSLFLALLLLLSLTSCGKKADPAPDSSPFTSSTAEEPDSSSSDTSAEGTGASDSNNSEDVNDAGEADSETDPEPEPPLLDADGTYSSKEEISLYLHQYGHLPGNFITKKEAQKLGWSGGSLEDYAPGMCIGGDRFGNYEKILPDAEGRSYQECDVDTLGAKKRGTKRIVFSNDGLIYYTEDHYESFVLLYDDTTS